MMGFLKNAGFFYFKREDVRLCARHATPFQPLQPAVSGSNGFGDVKARCPWCPGGELAKYWSKYPHPQHRIALMGALNKLLPVA